MPVPPRLPGGGEGPRRLCGTGGAVPAVGPGGRGGFIGGERDGSAPGAVWRQSDYKLYFL